jgi:hypothetical protein
MNQKILTLKRISEITVNSLRIVSIKLFRSATHLLEFNKVVSAGAQTEWSESMENLRNAITNAKMEKSVEDTMRTLFSKWHSLKISFVAQPNAWKWKMLLDTLQISRDKILKRRLVSLNLLLRTLI